MKKLKGLFKRLVDNNVQTLYKADFLNGDLELTPEGKDELLHILFDKNKEEFVKRAKEIIKEKKDKNEDEEDLLEEV